MLSAVPILLVFLLMTGISAAEMVVQGELEEVLAERLVEARLDPSSPYVVEAANTVLIQLKAEHEDTEHLLSLLRTDPDIIAQVSALAVDLSKAESDESNGDDPRDEEKPTDETNLPADDEQEDPVEEKSGLEKRAPRARAIERLQEHLERGLPVENALAAVTKEKHRERWAEREGQEPDNADEEPDGDLDDMREDEDFDDPDDIGEIPEASLEPGEGEELDENDDTQQSKQERIEEKSKSKIEKEITKRERKVEKEKSKQAKREKKQDAQKARRQEKGRKQ